MIDQEAAETIGAARKGLERSTRVSSISCDPRPSATGICLCYLCAVAVPRCLALCVYGKIEYGLSASFGYMRHPRGVRRVS
jgi:hypothetical protein